MTANDTGRPRWMSKATADQPRFCGWCGSRHGLTGGGTCFVAARASNPSDSDGLSGGTWQYDPRTRVQRWVADGDY